MLGLDWGLLGFGVMVRREEDPGGEGHALKDDGPWRSEVSRYAFERGWLLSHGMKIEN